jgi:hypothetical protein
MTELSPYQKMAIKFSTQNKFSLIEIPIGEKRNIIIGYNCINVPNRTWTLKLA